MRLLVPLIQNEIWTGQIPCVTLTKHQVKTDKTSFLQHQRTAVADRAPSVWTPSEVEQRQRAWCHCGNAPQLVLWQQKCLKLTEIRHFGIRAAAPKSKVCPETSSLITNQQRLIWNFVNNSAIITNHSTASVQTGLQLKSLIWQCSTTRGRSHGAFTQLTRLTSALYSSVNPSERSSSSSSESGKKTRPEHFCFWTFAVFFLQPREKRFITVKWLTTFKYVQTFCAVILKQKEEEFTISSL